MIGNVVVGQLCAGVETARRRRCWAIAALELDGVLDCRNGTDLRCANKSWEFAITSDSVDEAAYQATTSTAEHLHSACLRVLAPEAIRMPASRERPQLRATTELVSSDGPALLCGRTW